MIRRLLACFFLFLAPFPCMALDPFAAGLAAQGIIRGFDFIFNGKNEKTTVRESLSGKSSHAGVLKDAVFELAFGRKSAELAGKTILDARRHVIIRISGPLPLLIFRSLTEARKRGVGVMILAGRESACARRDIVEMLKGAGILFRFSKNPPGGDFIGIDGNVIVMGLPGESVLVFRNAPALAHEYALEWKIAWDEAGMPGQKKR